MPDEEVMYGAVKVNDNRTHMGSSESTLKRDIEIGEAVPRSSAIYRIWTDVYPCVEVKKWRRTLFIRHFAETDSNETRSFFENGIKRLRQLRHPYIVYYVKSSLNANEFTLLTERVEMLDLAIDSQSPIEVHTGLIHILHALIFLHEKASLTHNNLCPSSVLVASNGSWKLGGFECAQDLHNTRHWVQSDFVRSVKNSEFAPPEDQVMLKTDIPPTARDVFAFGKLITYAMPYIQNRLPGMPETILALETVSRCLTNVDATKRGELAGVEKSHTEAFKNSLSMVVDFLQTIHLRTHQQKASFFQNVVDWLSDIPATVVGKRLIPLLLSRYVLLEQEAHSKLLPFILRPFDLENDEQINGLLSSSDYRKWVLPELLRIFRVHESLVRLALLAHFPLYMPFFTRVQLETVVLPELVLGMRDTDDCLVSASLHAMAHLVPVLGGSTVTGVTHTKSFANGTPKKEGIYSPPSGLLSRTSSPSNLSVRRCEMPMELKDESISPSSHLSRLLSDDDLPEESDVRLQLMPQIDDDITELQRNTPIAAQSTEWAGATEGDWSSEWDEYEEVTPSGSPPRTEDGITEAGKAAAKKIVDEVDYFAGMEPVFAKPPSLIERLERKVAESINETKKTGTDRFAVLPESECIAEETNLGAWETTVADWDAD